MFDVYNSKNSKKMLRMYKLAIFSYFPQGNGTDSCIAIFEPNSIKFSKHVPE